MILETEWERMYNPILWNIFVTGVDWDNYICLRQMKMDKKTIYKDKQTYLDYIKPEWKNIQPKN
jgi:hypothetical protein